MGIQNPSHPRCGRANARQLLASCCGRLFELLALLAMQILSFGCRMEQADTQLFQHNPPPMHFTKEALPTPTQKLSGDIAMGSAKLSMNVPEHHPLAGYGGLKRRFLFPVQDGTQGSAFKPHTEVDSQATPSVKASVLSDTSGNHLYLLSIDTVAVSADFSLSLVNFLSRTSPSLSINHSNTVIAATHTHSGPAGLSFNPFWQPFASGYYNETFFNYISTITLKAIRQARDSQKAVTSVAYRQADLKEYIKNRTPQTSLNTSGASLLFKTAQDEIAGCFLIIPLHPTHYGTGDSVLSADYAGHIERSYTQLIDQQTECFFFNGAGGNAAANIKTDSPQTYSQQLAEALFQSAETLKPINLIQLHSRVVTLGKPKFNLEGCGAGLFSPFLQIPFLQTALPRTTVLQNLQLGESLSLRFFPGEITQGAWETLKQAENEIPITLSNDYTGYFVSQEHYKRESIESCSSLYGKSGLFYLDEMIPNVQ